jgi:LmbE family N-acetylglucosaminyl deacetylase
MAGSMEKCDILVFAPHPDDEAIACTGMMYKALSENKRVRVVVVTNGEASVEGTEWYYGRKPTTRDFIDIGHVRQNESMAAMKVLGLEPDDVVFLGYPDSGLTAMISSDKYTGDNPFRSEFTDFNSVSHENSFSIGAPYCRESLSNDITHLIAKSQPGRIYVTHPLDSHTDHRVCGELVSGIADKTLESCTVMGYMIASSGVPSPKRRLVYKSTGQLTEEYLDEKTRKIKEQCIKTYKSQFFLFEQLTFHFDVERFWKLDKGMRAAIASKLFPDLKY